MLSARAREVVCGLEMRFIYEGWYEGFCLVDEFLDGFLLGEEWF